MVEVKDSEGGGEGRSAPVLSLYSDVAAVNFQRDVESIEVEYADRAVLWTHVFYVVFRYVLLTLWQSSAPSAASGATTPNIPSVGLGMFGNYWVSREKAAASARRGEMGLCLVAWVAQRRRAVVLSLGCIPSVRKGPRRKVTGDAMRHSAIPA